MANGTGSAVSRSSEAREHEMLAAVWARKEAEKRLHPLVSLFSREDAGEEALALGEDPALDQRERARQAAIEEEALLRSVWDRHQQRKEGSQPTLIPAPEREPLERELLDRFSRGEGSGAGVPIAPTAPQLAMPRDLSNWPGSADGPGQSAQVHDLVYEPGTGEDPMVINPVYRPEEWRGSGVMPVTASAGTAAPVQLAQAQAVPSAQPMSTDGSIPSASGPSIISPHAFDRYFGEAAEGPAPDWTLGGSLNPPEAAMLEGLADEPFDPTSGGRQENPDLEDVGAGLGPAPTPSPARTDASLPPPKPAIEGQRWMEDTDNPGTVIFVGPSGNPGADRGYGPHLPGWHYYVTDANLVCPAELACTEEEMAEYLARFTVPGWDPNNPVVDRGRYPVYDPRNDIFAGEVRVAISNGGLTNINSTLPGHVFHDGQVVRSLVRNAAGDWFVITEGFGNNPNGFYNGLNKEAGPVLFNYIDRQMYKYIMEDRMPKIEP